VIFGNDNHGFELLKMEVDRHHEKMKNEVADLKAHWDLLLQFVLAEVGNRDRYQLKAATIARTIEAVAYIKRMSEENSLFAHSVFWDAEGLEPEERKKYYDGCKRKQIFHVLKVLDDSRKTPKWDFTK